MIPHAALWTAALLELDVQSVGQWMLHRPIVLGPLLGLMTGQWELGAAMGVTLELLYADALPIGSWIPPNAAVATGSSLILSSMQDLPPGACLLAGLAMGSAYSLWADQPLRQWRSRWNDSSAPLSRILALCLASEVLCAAASLYAFALLSPVIGAAWGRLPEILIQGAEALWKLAPLLGAATLLSILNPFK